ncbi:MAG: tRNA (adenosine(37)-N6)-dimethylallyltransferase MiaA [Desulfuromonadales bacterium]|nr:tRNA (adenosine(37)-N6)-dimethylallyltransferase MiaA [Desulfuromonadales bacterium]
MQTEEINKTLRLPTVIVITGPTASGKSNLSLLIAEKFNGEIVNADSMQVYKGMDIGTAKPSINTMKRVKHHLFDIVAPDINFTASDYSELGKITVENIFSRGKIPIITGGTGLYIRALLSGIAPLPGSDEKLRIKFIKIAEKNGNAALLKELEAVDPVTASCLHQNDQLRIIRGLEVFYKTGIPLSEYQALHGFSENWCNAIKIGIMVEREELYRRINARVDAMIAGGFIEEVKKLLEQGYGREYKALRSIGYKEICSYLAGEYSFEEMLELIKRDTRRYAKRQITWFKKESDIYWFKDSDSFATISEPVMEFLYLRRLS